MSAPLRALALVLLAAAAVRAQEPAPSPPPDAEGTLAPPEVIEFPPTPEPAPRYGSFRLGPFWASPMFKVREVGLDTNVFYTPTERQTDVFVAGGPGLELVWPLARTWRLSTLGDLDYTYFARTPSQRRLGGGVRARLDHEAGRNQLNLEGQWRRTYERPDYEVDTRVLRDTGRASVAVRERLFGRVRVRAGGHLVNTSLPEGGEFAGVDLAQTLTTRERALEGGLDYALTFKTRALLELARTASEFPEQPARNGTIDRLWGGLETEPTALVSGHLRLGVGQLRLDSGRTLDGQFLADLDATWSHSPRTHLGASYLQDLGYSSLADASDPTLQSKSLSVHLEKELAWRLDLRLRLSFTRFVSGLPPSAGAPPEVRRNDTARELWADLGYTFRGHLRVGGRATYTDRVSSYEDFGVDGLLLGLTVQYTP